MFGGINRTISLSDFADDIVQGTSPESKYYNQNKIGLPFYQGKKDFGSVYLREPNTWTTMSIKTSKKGDILMSVRAPVGDVNINPFNEISIGRGLCAIRCSTIKNKVYLFYWLLIHSNEVKGHDGMTFDSISGNEIKGIQIPLASQELINEFASYIEEIDKLKFAIHRKNTPAKMRRG